MFGRLFGRLEKKRWKFFGRLFGRPPKNLKIFGRQILDDSSGDSSDQNLDDGSDQILDDSWPAVGIEFWTAVWTMSTRILISMPRTAFTQQKV